MRLETLQTQGRLRSLNRRLAPESRVRGMATIRRIQELCRELEIIVGADMREIAARNGHDGGDTPFPFLPPGTDAVQAQGNGELVTVSSAEASGRDAAEGDQLAPQGGGKGNPSHEPVVPTQEEAKLSTPERPQAPSRPAHTRTRRSKPSVTNEQGSGAPGQTAQDQTTSDTAPSTGEGWTINHPAPHPDEEAMAPAASTARSIDVSARIDHGHSVPGDRTRCGYCGATQFPCISEETDTIFCTCDSVYRPSTRRWHWRRESQPPSPPASVRVMDSVTQEEIRRGLSEPRARATAGEPAGMSGSSPRHNVS